MARGTRILMGDGSCKPIHEIQAGEYVATLEGAWRVQRAWRVGVKPCVSITTAAGTVLASERHNVLTVDDSWATQHSYRCEEIEIDNKASSAKQKQIKTECLWMNY